MNLTLGSRKRALLAALILSGAACNGSIGSKGPGQITGAGGNDGPTNVDPGKVTAPTTPFDPKTAFYATSKVKNLLTGQPVTDDDVAKVTMKGAAALQELVNTWQTTDPYQGQVAAKMVGFFRNMFQQTGFIRPRTSRSSCCRTAASISAAARATSATTRSRGSCRTCRTASPSPPGRSSRKATRSPRR
jgi:hypothetical protein